jgi:hypothetical protein
MCRLRKRALRLLLGGLVLLPGGSASLASAQGNSLDKLLDMQMNWDAAKTDDQAKPVGTLEFVPFAHHRQDGKSFTSYYVYARGVRQNTPYTLIRWQIGWGAELPPFDPVYTDMYVNARGVVMCKKPTEKENESDAPAIGSEARLEVTVAGALGEPVRFALLDARQSFVAMGRVIVSPVKSMDKTCQLQAIRAVAGAEILLVEGTEFSPNSAVELSREMDGKAQAAKFRTDAKGRMETAVILIGRGQSSGTAKLTVKSDACAPAVKMNWGHDSYQVQ